MVAVTTPLCPSCQLGLTEQVAVTTAVTLYWCPYCGTLLGARTSNVSSSAGAPKVPQMSAYFTNLPGGQPRGKP
jgi:predicted RNA-binding Zn-ribbon protein involved in translation (DUF1610 family)